MKKGLPMHPNGRVMLTGFLICLVFPLTLWSQTGLQAPQHLTCEYHPDRPLIDHKKPRLGWKNFAEDPLMRGKAQTAYQIQVSTDSLNWEEAALWDSKKVISNNSTRISYAGKPLKSHQTCWWRVRVWDEKDTPSEWSQVHGWRMGILSSGEWQAKWIGVPWQGEKAFPRPKGGPNGIPENFGPPAPLFRKAIPITKPIQKATAYVTGLGYFELYANGQKVGDDVLVPNQTNYGKRPKLPEYDISVPDKFSRYSVMYLAYDLSEMLNEGENVLGGIVGNGFYNPAKFWTEGYGTPRFLLQLHLTYEDGTQEVISTDESWQVSKSPILMNMVYYGETYDARKEQTEWSSPGFNSSEWESAILRTPPAGELTAHTAFTDKVMERLKPLSITKLGEGHYAVDFGKEISGWVKLQTLKARAGHRIDISFNGNLYSGDNTYICSGKNPESYAPRFNWFVFSGVEVKNWPGELKPQHLVAESVHTYIQESATFHSSNPMLEQIVEIWKQSQVDNMHGGIVSDCPHRERSGYTGDGQVACSMVMQTYDAQNFYQKWIGDIIDAQIPESGYVPNGAPWQPGCGGGVAWGAAINIIPWEFYLQYGDIDILKDSYEAMKGYIRYLDTWKRPDGIVHSQRKGANGEINKWFNLGDWAPVEELPPNELVHTFYYWLCATKTAQSASVLGFADEAVHYQSLAEAAWKDFHATFYDAEQGSYGPYGGDILALKMGVPEERFPKVLASLRKTVAKNNGHLDTGIFGTRYFFEVLTQYGMHELAYEAMVKKEAPGFGHWLELGSTTTREHWDNKGSHNHPMFGGGLNWLYNDLAGMKADPQQPGYRHIIFQPQPVAGLDSVSYFQETVFGTAGIIWTKKEGIFVVELKVPVGCTAEILLPDNIEGEEIEAGAIISEQEGIAVMDKKEGTGYQLQSGRYSFRMNLKR